MVASARPRMKADLIGDASANLPGLLHLPAAKSTFASNSSSCTLILIDTRPARRLLLRPTKISVAETKTSREGESEHAATPGAQLGYCTEPELLVSLALAPGRVELAAGARIVPGARQCVL
jgi:hypothetical protein